MATKHVVTDDQKVSFMRRTRELDRLIDLPDGSPLDPVQTEVGLEVLQLFVEGRHEEAMELLKQSVTAQALGQPTTINIKREIEAMIRAGCHKKTNGGKGMSAKDYRAMWQRAVVLQPAEYKGRFDTPLLVDLTITPEDLLACGKIIKYVEPAQCKDHTSVPSHDGKLVTRYVAFCQDGTQHLKEDHTVEWCSENVTQDEVLLVTREGLHLPIQWASQLKHHGVDIAGASFGADSAPCVFWFGYGLPRFHALHVGGRSSGFGSASRGSIVIPVF